MGVALPEAQPTAAFIGSAIVEGSRDVVIRRVVEKWPATKDCLQISLYEMRCWKKRHIYNTGKTLHRRTRGSLTCLVFWHPTLKFRVGLRTSDFHMQDQCHSLILVSLLSLHACAAHLFSEIQDIPYLRHLKVGRYCA
ncbi:putative Isoamyl acetate-hydrolyzing esterase 1 like protein [Fusarium oxysporum f. sp. albedinis]|nr:putative Isoamyl acetate-hydrolyzing esterase 1 like protein [Fusarium oxysporum f. sp. albedinis]